MASVAPILAAQTYRGRVRSGCLTCRARKIKCDEGKPICARCKRIDRECIYKPRRIQRQGLQSCYTSSPAESQIQDDSTRAQAEDGHTAHALLLLQHDVTHEEFGLESQVAGPTITTTTTPRLPFTSQPSPPESLSTAHSDISQATPRSVPHHHVSPQTDRSLSTAQVTAQLEKALWRNRYDAGRPLAAHDAVAVSSPLDSGGGDTESPSALISRDIELTTTMDLITARGLPASDVMSASGTSSVRSPSTEFFLHHVDCPGITTFDPVNWAAAKRRFIQLAAASPVVAEAIAAVCAVYRGQLYSVSVPGVKPLYDSARMLLQESCTRIEDSEVQAVDTRHRHECILAASFLLTLAELVHNDGPYEADSGPVLMADDDVASSFERWVGFRTTCPMGLSPLSARLVAWLRVVHRITLRGGGTGLISDRVYNALCRLHGDVDIQFRDSGSLVYDHALEVESTSINEARHLSTSHITPIPNIETDHQTSAEDMLYLALSAPLFTFYYRLQLLSGHVARLTHYHRSRVTADDQDVVSARIAGIRVSLHALWSATGTGDPGRMVIAGGLDAEALKGGEQERGSGLVSGSVARRLVKVMRLCEAAYHAEIVELDRVLGDPVQRYTAESRASVRAIRRLVDAAVCASDEGQRQSEGGQTSQDAGRLSRDMPPTGQVSLRPVSRSGPPQTSHTHPGPRTTLDPGFLRPLFLCAIETIDEPEQTEWAVQRMAQVRDQIYRSDFFATFGWALAQAQQGKERRVTSRYFCLWYFGVQPPFM